jgi:hypothetical protein
MLIKGLCEKFPIWQTGKNSRRTGIEIPSFCGLSGNYPGIEAALYPIGAIRQPARAAKLGQWWMLLRGWNLRASRREVSSA